MSLLFNITYLPVLSETEERHDSSAEYHYTCESKDDYSHPHLLLWLIAHIYHLLMTFFHTLAAVRELVAEDVSTLLFAEFGAFSSSAVSLAGLPARTLL